MWLAVRRPVGALLASTLLAVTGCGGPEAAPPPGSDVGDWDAVLVEAQGRTVRWALPEADPRLVEVLEREVTPRLADLGVSLDLVAADQPADLVGVDSAGLAAGLGGGSGEDRWRCDWAQQLPNADLVDTRSPALRRDLGADAPGCGSPWRQAHASLVYDADVLAPGDVASVEALLAWARSEPGRFTYPAPPDPTGTLVLRTVLDATIGGPGELAREVDEASDQYAGAARRLWERLVDLAPSLWRGGATYPATARDVERLYATGDVDAYLTLAPERVAPQVADGTYRPSTTQAVPAPGNHGDPSWLALPADADAPSQAAALVLADVLLDPEVQLAMWRDAGAAPVVDPARTEPAVRRGFETTPQSLAGPGGISLVELTRRPRPELAQVYVEGLVGSWAEEVTRSSG